ncbi:ABATE domain-containing protein, partial [Streptomyces nigra]
MERWLALELASTIRHDGDGGVADDLASVEGVTRWVEAQAESLSGQVH